MIDEKLMSFEERSAGKLRSLYTKYGYLPYEMSKFEEYELYLQNKDFLVSDRVITFNDTDGKLMALKPDVTLSIIKNGEDLPGIKQKVFYNENVYRVSEATHRFKEIMQTGLECIGDIDIYDIYETISLAAESLSEFSSDFCIEISNLDFVSSIVSSICNNPSFIKKVIGCISEKNSHDLKKVCEKYSVNDEGYNKISSLISLYGDRKKVIGALKELFDGPEIKEMDTLSSMLDQSNFSDKIKFDFSIINDMHYYNGFVYRGFLSGVSLGVLAGGQYDKMMEKMNRNSRAIGFAIYLDHIADLFREKDKVDVDYLLLYDSSTDLSLVTKTVKEHIEKGFSITTQKCIPEKLRYNNIIDLRKKD